MIVSTTSHQQEFSNSTQLWTHLI